jgi:competence protein ComEA
LLKKVVSVSAGMVGLSVIGLVAGAPERERLDLMGVSGDLGGTWLAGAEAHSAEASGSAQARQEPKAPTPGDDVTPAAAPSGSAGSPSPSASATSAGPQGGITADGKVILNLATLDELTRLPGIGQKRAQKIVTLRERLGRFKKPTDLLRIKGIGPKSLRKMLPHLVLDPPTRG